MKLTDSPDARAHAAQRTEVPDEVPPEVRQCQDPTSFLYGSIAVPGEGQMAGQWFIGNPRAGGHWGPESDVEDWPTATEWTT